jgi:hypothetical protein
LAPDTVSALWFHTPRGLHSTRMVNDRFPARPIYGFEMVDVPLATDFAAFSTINRKFTPNRIFEIFCKFSPNLVQ